MEEEEGYKRNERIALVVILVMASVSVVSLLVTFIYYCYIANNVSRRLKKRKKGSEIEEKSSSSCNIQVATENGLQEFTFKQLHLTTGGFSKSNVIGHGGFGLVYRGVLQDGRKVSVKLMDQAGKQGEEEFQVEVELLSWLHSPYLLGLIGYCSDSSHKLLVYEFMANGGAGTFVSHQWQLGA